MQQQWDANRAISAGDVARILWRRLWIVALIMMVSVGTAAYVSKHTPKRWRADASVILIQRATTVTPTAQASYTAPMIETPETQLALLQSYAMAGRSLAYLKNQALAKGQSGDDLNLTPDDLQKAITISNPKDTNILDVQVEAGSRERAEQLANAVCLAFVQWKKDVAKQDVEDMTNSLQVRADRAKAEMQAAERRETAFKNSHHLVDVSTQQKDALQQYLTRETDVATEQQELVSDEARLKSLGDRLQTLDTQIKNGTGVRDDSLVLSLQQQLSASEIERANMAQKYTPAYPGVLPELDARIADIKQRLAKAVQGTLDNKKPSLQAQGALFEDYKKAQTDVIYQRAKVGVAIKLRDDLKSQLAGLPQTSQQYASLVRDADMASSLYTSLQSTLNAARLDKDMATGNVQMAQYAFAPEQPFRPDHIRDVLFGAAIGLFLSLVSVLLLEQSDRRIRDIESARRALSGPIVGALPEMSRAEMRDLLAGEPLPLAVESYSLTRANLALALRSVALAESWQHPILMITSAIPGEGKSLTAAELARSMARTGKHVILVDADMRRPSQNRLFRTAEPHGLADVLSGDMSLEEALVAGDVENLSILHSGTPRRNPTELISLPQMKETLEALRGEADVVIVDTPAAATVADALLLAPHVDCVLHVVGVGLVDEGVVQETSEALNAAAPKAMVYFLNRARRSGSGYGKYYYRYRDDQYGQRVPSLPRPEIEEVEK
ncbi:MAG TPA: polysaccharide biosynthesis tyrosine autokinase [Chthonomonadaceae bacterium]|nr:polysaccharide biosynthesis tyrosine autokinase [Chthonomonadaceae bacterium]